MDCERDKENIDGEYRDMLGECHCTELREKNFCRGGNQIWVSNYSCKHGDEEVECLCQFHFFMTLTTRPRKNIFMRHQVYVHVKD